MIKKKKENKDFNSFESLIDKEPDEFIIKYIKEKYKNANIIDTRASGTSGSIEKVEKYFLRKVTIKRYLYGTVIFYKNVRVWDSRELHKYKGKRKFSKIIYNEF